MKFSWSKKENFIGQFRKYALGVLREYLREKCILSYGIFGASVKQCILSYGFLARVSSKSKSEREKR